MGKVTKMIFGFLMIFFVILSCNESSIKNIDINISRFYIKEIGYKNFNLIKLNNINIDNLNRIDSVLESQIKNKYTNGNKVREYYYYSVLDTTKYYSIVLYRYHEYYKSFEVFNILKSGNIIDSETLFLSGGDGEYFYETESKFVNDSIIKQESKEGYYSYDPDSLIIDKSEKSIIKLKSTGKILVKKKH